MAHSRPPLVPLAVVVAACAFGAVAARSADALPGASPFGAADPASAPAAAPGAAGERFELKGMIASPKGPVLSIARQGRPGSVWIPVGETRDGVTVLSYDARRDRAVIRAAGRKLTLTLRAGRVVPGENAAPEPPVADDPPASPAPAAAPTELSIATEPLPAPDSDAAQATEARMLVSDLLDIGQQQRQAYEEAARAADRRARGLEPAATDTATTPAPPAAADQPSESTDDSATSATPPDDASAAPSTDADDATSGDAASSTDATPPSEPDHN